MKTDRLVAILVMLLRKQRVQAKEMAEKFGVSVRTILRDVEAINLAGIPVVTYQGSGGGIGLAEGYRLDKSVLNADEMAAVIATLKGIDKTVSGSSHEILMEKLKNTLTAPQLESLNTKLKQFVIDLSPWRENDPTKEKLAIIRRAIEASELLEFTYIDSQSRKTDRRVEPYSLILKAQNWYLYAWCSLRSSFRYFRVSRIRELRLSGTGFQPRDADPGQISDEWQPPADMVPLVLSFSPRMESVIPDWFGGEMQRCDDGRIVVETALPESGWLYGFLLSFGAEIEVVSPPHIRAALAAISRKIYEKYAPEQDV